MKYIIVGNSDYAHMLYGYMIEREGDEIIAFSVEKEFIDNTEMYGKKVIAYEEIENVFSPEDVQLLLAIGYSGMNDVKEKLYNLYTEKGYRFGTYIHPSAIIGKDVVMGEGNIIFEGTIIQNGCVIGNANSFFVRSTIAHDCVIGDFNSFACASLAGRVTVKNKCFFGMGCVVNADVAIEDQAFIGAAAYVSTDIKKERVVLGEKSKIIDREFSKRVL